MLLHWDAGHIQLHYSIIWSMHLLTIWSIRVYRLATLVCDWHCLRGACTCHARWNVCEILSYLHIVGITITMALFFDHPNYHPSPLCFACLSYSSLKYSRNGSMFVLFFAEIANTGSFIRSLSNARFSNDPGKSILLPITAWGLLDMPDWYCSNSNLRSSSWVQGCGTERSIMYSKHEHRSMCRRNDTPNPRFSCAPWIKPGISATAWNNKKFIKIYLMCSFGY